ncbi:MAG TPA: hypothetical protein P5150_03165 [Candidatus Ratteibacteria bacterium]|nr:hypothetical protein [bacterium]HRR95716.1 hypothetical protein [Candidatus Ratteibacteria bacterium]
MYLVDTNVWLERLLDQKELPAVKNFLNKISSELLFIMDFYFHSISLIMIKLGQRIGKFNLDFDDTYQYVSAEKYGLTLVSFDSDFDSTKPEEIINI